MTDARYRSAADLFGDWRSDVVSGKPPTLYEVGDGELARLEVGPGLVTLIGGAPGAGKTALVMQLLVTALERTPTLRALVCNVEMSLPILLDRQLARLSGIDLTLIRHRRLGDEHAERIDEGLKALERIAERLSFVRPPFDIANIAASADAFEADLLLLDYIQRIGPSGEHRDRRAAVDSSIGSLRRFADAGKAILVVAALARSKDSRGRSSYDEGLGLASFRETSELEYGADDAFNLTPGTDPDGVLTDRVVMRHLKSRHGEARDLNLVFDRPRQRFSSDVPTSTANRAADKEVRAKLQFLWSSTTSCEEESYR